MGERGVQEQDYRQRLGDFRTTGTGTTTAGGIAPPPAPPSSPTPTRSAAVRPRSNTAVMGSGVPRRCWCWPGPDCCWPSRGRVRAGPGARLGSGLGGRRAPLVAGGRL